MSTPEPAGVIRTPDQRLRVFVSSTLGELADERAVVARAIEELRLTPVMFELGARPHPPRELYRAYLAQSDVFIGLYWQRYGWTGPDMDISGLEDEFRLSESMPRLLYLKAPAPEREPRLAAMIERIQSTGRESYRTFHGAEELDRLVRDDLALLLSERFSARSDTTSEPSTRSELPVATTSLVGRGGALDELTALLEASDVRLVTLTGPGGIGKTRLAVAAAERVQHRFDQGAVFVPLASIGDPKLVVPEIASALGATLEGSRDPVSSVAERIGDRSMLLVLDNLEQVVAVAPELEVLLASCPRLVILATSRTVLRLRAEREFPVGALAVPASPDEQADDELASVPAVRLFVERARARRPGFALTRDNAPAVAAIARRLEGVPLAIELAAARVRLLDPDDLLARLQRGLDTLGTGPVDLPERQRTLRATVEWSLGLLDDAERHVIAAMSVFVGSWSLDAAVHVRDIDEDRALDLLDSLAGQSLVDVAPSEYGPRFRMLESVREVAAELLADPVERAEVERRHAQYFGETVSNASSPGKVQDEWARELRSDEGNVRRAVRWFFDHDIAPLPRMFRVLWWFWQLNDRMREGRDWIEQLMPRVGQLDEPQRIDLALTAAITAIEVGDDDGALEAARQIEALKDRITDPFLSSWAQLALAWTRPIEDDLDGALDAGYRAIDGFGAQDEPFMTGSALMTVGMLELAQGNADAARPFLADVEAIGARYQSDWLAAGAQVLYAVIAMQEGRYDEAHERLRAVLDASDHTEISTHTVSFCLVAQAQLALAEGDTVLAATALGAAEGARQRAGLQPWPSLRKGEALLLDNVRSTLGDAEFDERFAAGSLLSRQQAVELVRAAAA